MGKVHVRTVRDGDAEYLAAHMREADREEVEAATGESPYEALVDGLRISTHAFAAERDGRLIALWGFTPISLLSGIGVPWMLGTDEVYRCGRSLTRVAKASFEHVQPLYPVLLNYVDARNTRAIRWLQFVGFQVFEAEPYGVAQLPFHRFEMRA